MFGAITFGAITSVYRYFICVLIIVMISGGFPASAAADEGTPADLDSNAASWFEFADRCILGAVERGELPGAVLLAGRGDEIVYRKAYGHRAVEPAKVPMTPDTVFDMASCTKVIATATSIVMLADRGKLTLSDRVSRYLPDFGTNGKEEITVEQLLLHTSGLIPDNSLSDYEDGPAKAIENIMNLPTRYPVNSRFCYSDVNYIVLAEIVRMVSGRPLDAFARDEIFKPLGMNDTCYRPDAAHKARCAPTCMRDGAWIVGDVHDPRAWALGGVAGHAGLFSTADDVARYCRMMLNGGELEGVRILSKEAVDEMTRCRLTPDGRGRGYGWDIDTGYASPRGLLFPKLVSYGHTGFTGTSMWIDPQHGVYVVLLSNSVHPKQGRSINELRRQVGTAVAAALIPAAFENKARAIAAERFAPPQPIRQTCDSAHGPPAEVICGIDVLASEGFKILEGRKIAVITNHTGRDRQGRRTIDLLVGQPGLEVLKAFSPEHGLYGVLDEAVGNTVDPETGLQVYSLYGKTRRPTPEMLEGIDTIVYDIQDIGVRYYTYPATLGYAMEEAAKRNIKVVVLDRPNPITGLIVDGPLADRSKLGFTAYVSEPVVHGMTIGELARMFNETRRIGCDLTVVPVRGWKRHMWWDQTGLVWTNPSPNMRNLTQAVVYPVTGLLEFSNLSVGRGTDQPFEFFGAPWIDAVRLSAALNGANLPGLRFIPFEFTPASSKFAGEACQGIYVLVTQREAIEPVRSGLTIAWHLYRLFGDKFEVDKVGKLLANAEVAQAIKTIGDPSQLPALWQESVHDWKHTRAQYLIYPE